MITYGMIKVLTDEFFLLSSDFAASVQSEKRENCISSLFPLLSIHSVILRCCVELKEQITISIYILRRDRENQGCQEKKISAMFSFFFLIFSKGHEIIIKSNFVMNEKL